MIGAAVHDPKRRFGTLNYRITKGSFDHVVGDREHVLRHLDAERARRLQIDDELKFGRLQQRQLDGLGALEGAPSSSHWQRTHEPAFGPKRIQTPIQMVGPTGRTLEDLAIIPGRSDNLGGPIMCQP